MTIRELADSFLEFKKKRVKAASLISYALIIRTKIVPYFADRDISQGITPKEANAFIEEMLETVSVKSAQDINVVLYMLFQHGHIEHDMPPSQWRINWPSKNLLIEKRIKCFSKDECKKIFNLMEQEPSPYVLGMVIGLTTGMRIGEICGLKFSDIDFERKILHVQRTAERIHDPEGLCNVDELNVCKTVNARGPKGCIVLNTPKTIHSDRLIPLTKQVLKWLKKYRDVSSEDAFVLTLCGRVSEPRTFRTKYSRILKSLGIAYLNPHCMRHTCATQMLQAKTDVATIASILGHSSPAVTLEIYSHTDENEKAKAIKNTFGKFWK